MTDNQLERTMNNVMAYLWLFIAVFCIVGAIGWGAWWHLFTAGISYVMYKAMYIPKSDNETTE